MASSSSSNSFHHSRSNSLPSRPHPVTSQLEENLHRIRTSSETTCSSSSSVSQKLNGLQDLHECVDELLALPLVQQAFSQQIHERWIDELLEGSLGLLDLCSIAKNSLPQTKEALHDLQSSMRRRKGAGQVQDTEVQKYLSTRKSVQKAMKKAILRLKSAKNDSASSLLRKDDEAVAFISLLREVEAATTSVFESVFCLISGTRQTRSSSIWSLVSKMMLKKITTSEEGKMDLNEFTKQDMALESLLSHRTSKVQDLMQVEQLSVGLKNLDLDIQDLEEGLESLYRRLIKSRVSLLNILNQ
ncbi:uncharacterized protein LOC116197077 [Punica granatum]|uniref:Uncharacterized protein n=2 Tax=Punica granatum TaxID=22663 RepID=A0A218X6D1_PUNGR|nr:uncharacterized protein LOC116197077 [Punica granatum]OWM80483.1 hypothetical protein CDL15_Pgr019763 [Punica granatum]PKI63730.1 hypothetical protein CRG98_015851 [Punica granatum]